MLLEDKMIDYLVPSYFLNFNVGAESGVSNPGGGMRTKILAVQRASRHYWIKPQTDVSSLKSDFVLVEPLWFRESLGANVSEVGNVSLTPERKLELLSQYSAFKILYCSEMEMLRWSGSFRSAVLEVFDLVTYNCEYQRVLFDALGVRNMVLLHDPIDENLFKPSESKKMTVVSTGLISPLKNSEFIRDLYKELVDLPVQTVFVGGSTLWGHHDADCMRLEYDIRNYCDIFVENAPQPVLAQYLAESSFFVSNSIHDTYSSGHAEGVSAGCISVCGGHELFRERPGYFVRAGVSNIVDVLIDLTDGFKKKPDKSLYDESRNWAVDNIGFDVFDDRLVNVVKKVISGGSNFGDTKLGNAQAANLNR